MVPCAFVRTGLSCLLGGCCVPLFEFLQFYRWDEKLRETAVQADHHLLADINRCEVGSAYIGETSRQLSSQFLKVC